MKKTIAVLTALAALCSLISCEEKKEDSKGDTEIIQSEETTEAEMPFREYKAEDFTDIKVKLNKQQTAPPVELNEYDLSWIEFEPRVSVCALPENRLIASFISFPNDTYKLDFYEYKGNTWEEMDTPESNNCTLFNGEFVTSYEKNKSLFTECSRFSLDTGLRSATLVSLSDKRVTYTVTDSLSTILFLQTQSAD